MWLAEALKEWREFYLLVGTAGATLVALLFVAASLGTGYLNKGRAGATRTFMSPVVIHFTTVFLISCFALAPSLNASVFATLVGLTSLAGVLIALIVMARVFASRDTRDPFDRLAYGVLPTISYLAVLVAAGMIFTGHAEALLLLAGALLLQVIVNIRNVWDLMLTMVRKHRGG